MSPIENYCQFEFKELKNVGDRETDKEPDNNLADVSPFIFGSNLLIAS